MPQSLGAGRSLLAVMLLTAVGVLSGCATSETALPRHVPAICVAPDETHEQVPKIEGPLTLASATELALVNNAQLIMARGTADVAEKMLLAASDRQDPEIGFAYSHSEADTLQANIYTNALGTIPMGQRAVSDGTSHALSFKYMPQNPFERCYKIRTAEYNANASYWDVRDAEWQIGINVRRMFAQLDFIEKDLAQLDELVAVQKTAFQATKELGKVGQLTAESQSAAARGYLAALYDQNKALQDRYQARAALANYIGVPAEQLRIMIDETAFPHVDASALKIDDLLRKAFDNRPDLMATEWRTRAAHAAYNQARSTQFPWLTTIEYSFGNTTTTGSKDPEDIGFGIDPNSPISENQQDGNSWRIQAWANIPIFSWMNHQPDVMLAQYKNAKTEESITMEHLERDVRSALEWMMDLRKNQLDYMAETAPIVYDMQNMLDNAETVTGLPPAKVAQIKIEIIQTQRSKLQAEYASRTALLDLEQAVGEPVTSSQNSVVESAAK